MLDAAACRNRVARLCARISSRLDGLVISRPEHVYYFSRLLPDPNSLNLGSSHFLLILPSGSTTLFTDNWLIPGQEPVADEIIVVEWYSGREPACNRHLAVSGRVGSQLRSAGLRRIGAEMASLPFSIAREVEEVVEIDDIIGSLREIKDPDELDAIRRAIGTAEAVHSASRELLAPALTEIEYYAALVERATKAAGRPFVMKCDLVSGDRAASGGGPPSTKVMREGELVILDIFPYVEGYRGDITNTLCVGGNPTPLQREAFECVHAALQAGESKLRSGTSAAEVFRAMDSVLRELGGSGKSLSAIPGFGGLSHHGGHALGLGHPEPPHIVPATDRTIQAGMVLALEPGLYHPSFGGLRLEHDYLITPEGFERLSRHRLGL